MNLEATMHDDWNPGNWLKEVSQAMEQVEKSTAENIRKDAQTLVPVDTGTLKQEIEVTKSKFEDGGYIVIAQGPGNYSVFYACIRGDMYVKMNKGHKPISQIKIGELVIGQDGLPHKVLNISSFPVTEKPDLVEVVTEYRKDNTHNLIVTHDHKILVFKNGVSFWEKAGNLDKSYQAFMPKKIDHKRGTGLKKICINCGIEYCDTMGHGQGKKYCLPACRNDHWSKGNNPHIGMKRSQETRIRMSLQKKEFLKKHPEKNINRILAQRGHTTGPEIKVEQYVKSLGLDYEKQFPIGRYLVDFYIPEINLAIEADGAFWHQDQDVDINRDKEIIKQIDDISIIHIHFTEKRFSKNIQYNPLDKAHYIQCNDSMNSFVNPEYFKPVRILSANRYNGGSKKSHPMLYDLTVEDVHSFLAGGVIVSNSFVELGTHAKKTDLQIHEMAAQPYLRPALKQNQSKFISSINDAFSGD